MTVNPPIDVRFTEAQMRALSLLAEERGRANRNKGIPDTTTSASKNYIPMTHKPDQISLDLYGVMGEAAYCLELGLPFSDIRVDQPGGDGGIDFTTGGLTVDVKMTTRRGYNLVRFKLNPTASIYILVWPKAHNEVSIVGAITGSRFNDICEPLAKWGVGYKCSWKELKPFVEFRDYINKRIDAAKPMIQF